MEDSVLPPPFWPKQLSYPDFLAQWSVHGVTHEDVVAFMEALRVTKQDQKEIMTCKQRSDLWFKSRGKRLTASNFGAVCGQNPFSRPKQVLQSMLWPKPFTCAAVRYGQDNEPVACSLFEEAIRKEDPDVVGFSYPGLVVSIEQPWLGASPDGCVHLRNGTIKGLEIKCPFKKELYPYCPAYYFAQIMGTAGLLGLKAYFFVVWTPETTQIEEYAFHKDYFLKMMMPTMQKFYFESYLPRAILKDKGLLKEGQVEVTQKGDEEEKKDNTQEEEKPQGEIPDFVL